MFVKENVNLIKTVFLFIPASAAQTSGELQNYLSRCDRSKLYLCVTAPR